MPIEEHNPQGLTPFINLNQTALTPVGVDAFVRRSFYVHCFESLHFAFFCSAFVFIGYLWNFIASLPTRISNEVQCSHTRSVSR